MSDDPPSNQRSNTFPNAHTAIAAPRSTVDPRATPSEASTPASPAATSSALAKHGARGRVQVAARAKHPGRPRSGTSFAEAVREHVDPVELIRIALDIARGQPAVCDLLWLRKKTEALAKGEPIPEITGVEVKWPTQAERLAALNFLRDSGYQRPAQTVEIGQAAKPPVDYAGLSDAELAQLESLHAKAAGMTIIDVASAEAKPRLLPAADEPEGD